MQRTYLFKKSKTDKEALISELSPKFIWILRDFTLESVHPETGEAISAKEYLEICLRKKMTGKNASDNNIIRDNLIKYFPDRDCVTLSRPVDDEKDLKNLTDFTFEKLKSSFKSEFMNLKKKVMKESQPKVIKGKRLNGPAVASLINSFVTAINDGAVPNINNAFESVIEEDIKHYYANALRLYETGLQEYDRATDDVDLIEQLAEKKLDALMHYNKVVAINPDTFSNSTYLSWFNEKKRLLDSKIEEKSSALVEKNTKKCIEYLIK